MSGTGGTLFTFGAFATAPRNTLLATANLTTLQGAALVIYAPTDLTTTDTLTMTLRCGSQNSSVSVGVSATAGTIAVSLPTDSIQVWDASSQAFSAVLTCPGTGVQISRSPCLISVSYMLQ